MLKKQRLPALYQVLQRLLGSGVDKALATKVYAKHYAREEKGLCSTCFSCAKGASGKTPAAQRELRAMTSEKYFVKEWNRKFNVRIFVTVIGPCRNQVICRRGKAMIEGTHSKPNPKVLK